MSTSRLVVALALCLSLAACKKKSGSSHCDKYAAMEVKCAEHGGEGVRNVARQFCEDAQKDKDTEVMAAMIALEAECAQTETECEPYKACIEKKKDETTPPGL